MNKLVIIAIACSVAGLALLAFVPSLQDEVYKTDMNLGEIETASVGQIVEMCGEVDRYKTTAQGHVFFKLTDYTGDLQVVFFNRTAARIGDVYSLEKYQNLCVRGKISRYKGEMELIGNSVRYV